ncbi:MAG: hypothetical protein II611_02455 [Treponema sp.]|nr:hypothetical protein [Treponema sp.]
MKNNFWETGTFFGVPASFFYPNFVADSSRICGVLCGFIGGFGRFHLDESGRLIKMGGWGDLDGCGEVILTEGKWYLDGNF